MTWSMTGVRVLVVEDEFLVAQLIQEMLEAAGCVVTGPIPRLPEAVEAAARERCDAAILDVNLGGDRIDPVAATLTQRGIPFAFVTGYGQEFLPNGYAGRPRLCKPFKRADLIATLTRLVQPAAVEGGQRS
jgi:CheY-like chemotaxis protein